MRQKLINYIDENYKYHNDVIVIREEDFDKIAVNCGITVKTVNKILREKGYLIEWCKNHSYIPKEPIKDSKELKLRMGKSINHILQGRSLRSNIGNLWNKIRKLIIKEEDYKCSICGYRDKENSKNLQLHEEYVIDEERNIIKVLGFKLLCRKCHCIKHFEGSVLLSGSSPKDQGLIRHFMAINECSHNTYRHELNLLKKSRKNQKVYKDIKREWKYEIAPNVPFKNEIELKLKEKSLLVGTDATVGIKKNVPKLSPIAITVAVGADKESIQERILYINNLNDEELYKILKKQWGKRTGFKVNGKTATIKSYGITDGTVKSNKVQRMLEHTNIAFSGKIESERQLMELIALFLTFKIEEKEVPVKESFFWEKGEAGSMLYNKFYTSFLYDVFMLTKSRVVHESICHICSILEIEDQDYYLRKFFTEKFLK